MKPEHALAEIRSATGRRLPVRKFADELSRELFSMGAVRLVPTLYVDYMELTDEGDRIVRTRL